MKRLVLSTAIAAVLAPSLSFATDSLDDVVITATRTARTADETLVPVTVITRSEIVNSAVHDALQAIEAAVPSFQLTRTGGISKQSSYFLRGADSKNLLVLIDGVRIGSATTGAAALEHIPAELIERIEVVRGPRSALYGAEAVGGVIHIFTRQGKRDSLHARLGLGSNDTRQLTLGGGIGTERTRLSVYASHQRSDHIDVLPTATSQPDRDGFEQNAANLALTHDFSKDTQAGIRLLRSQGRSDYDQIKGYDEAKKKSFYYPANTRLYGDTVQQIASAYLQSKLAPNWLARWQVSQSRDELSNVVLEDGLRSASDIDTRRDQLSWQNDIQLDGRNLVSIGLEWLDDRVSGDTTYAQTSRWNRAAFIQWQTGFGPVDASLALRHDDNEAFGGHTTGDINLGWKLGRGLTLLASHGTAFRAPNFNELYYPGFSNPDLQPETARSSEVGLRGRFDRYGFELNGFDTRKKDMITFGPNYLPVNIADARIKGMELAADARLGTWRLSASLTLLDHEDGNGKSLPRVADRQFKLGADGRTGRWSYGGTLLALSGTDDKNSGDLTGAERHNPGHTLLNLYAHYAIDRHWSAGVKINNALDRNYETADDYAMPGRTVFFSLVYQR